MLPFRFASLGATLAMGALVALAAPAQAQDTGEPGVRAVPVFGTVADVDTPDLDEPTVAQTSVGDRLRYRLMALGGVTGLGGDGLHPYGGVEGGVLYRRVGALALGQYGTGNDFTSILLAGGPAFEVVDLEFAALTAYAGAGLYSEEISSGFSRDTGILYGGLSIRVPVGRFALGATVSYWQGELEGGEILNPVKIRSHRFSFGVGL